MRQRSETWAKLAVRGRFGMDVAAEIGGVTYTTISAPVIDRALLSDGLSVGNCISASMKVSVLTDDVIPPAASVVIKARIFDSSTASEWLTFGTFYIDKREENNGLVTLQCFDSMLKANQNCVDPSDPQDRIGWPKSMKRVVEEIAERIGVEIDPRTVIKTTDPYQVAYPTNYTMQQVLGFIGACHGGNWIITPENKLRLVPIVTPPSETFDIIDYEYNKIHTSDGYKLVYQHYETGEPVINPAGGDLLNVPIVIGKITTAKRMKISRVTLARDDTLGYTLGDDTGIEIRIESNPYACQAICDDLYAALKGVEYAPFTISKACYDPCAELGDWIIVGSEVRSTLYSQKITLGTDFRADAAAPGKDETSTEYPYLTEIQKLHREDERLKAYMEDEKTIISSRIEQTYEQIILEVSGTYATKDEVSSSISLTAESIDIEVKRATAAEEALSGRLSVTEGSITAEVTRATGAEAELSSRLTVTEDGIAAEVVRATGSEESLNTKIEVTASAIRSEVSSSVANLEAGITEDYTSAIEQLAKSITLTVTNSTDSSTIKLTGDGITAQSRTIKFTGDVIFASDLTDGQTTISGDNIKTGHLSADRIYGGTLILGGNNNGNGLLEVRKSNGTTFGTMSNTGLSFSATGKVGTSSYTYEANMNEQGLTFRINSATTLNIAALYGNNASDVYTGFSVYRPLVFVPGSGGSTAFRYGGSEGAGSYPAMFYFGSAVSMTSLSVTGSKAREVETEDYGNRLLYCYEMPSPMFGDIGTGQTDSTGVCFIAFDDVFFETINADIEYQVFLQKEGEGDLWVSEKSVGAFVVKGTPGLKFSWEVKIKQRDFEYLRLEDIETQKEETPSTIDYEAEAAKMVEEYINELEEFI